MINNKKGFTLIEVVVVVTIIAILLSIAIPSISEVVGSGNRSADKARAGLYESALKVYVSRHAQVGTYIYIPENAADRVANSIASVLNEEVEFKTETKSWAFFYNPTNLQVLALDVDEGLAIDGMKQLKKDDDDILTGNPIDGPFL